MSDKKVKVLDWLPEEIKISSTEKEGGLVKCEVRAKHGFPEFTEKTGEVSVGFLVKETESISNVMKHLAGCLYSVSRVLAIKYAKWCGHSGREEEFLKENGIDLGDLITPEELRIK